MLADYESREAYHVSPADLTGYQNSAHISERFAMDIY